MVSRSAWLRTRGGPGRLAAARLTLLVVSLLGCAKSEQPRTELMLVADTDITDLDSIRFVIEGDNRQESEQAAPRADGAPLTLGLVLDQGSLGPLLITAEGIRSGALVIERKASVSFVPGKTLVVPLHLVASCEGKYCYPGRTCSERGCESQVLDEAQLGAWNGHAPELGPTSGADAGQDLANPGDAGGLVTCGVDFFVDLSSDVAHCGDCATSCKATGKNAVAACVGGACAVECRLLYGDCDGNEGNGCEQGLALSPNCGVCGLTCATGTVCYWGICR